jgi:hypothetical protein
MPIMTENKHHIHLRIHCRNDTKYITHLAKTIKALTLTRRQPYASGRSTSYMATNNANRLGRAHDVVRIAYSVRSILMIEINLFTDTAQARWAMFSRSMLSVSYRV